MNFEKIMTTFGNLLIVSTFIWKKYKKTLHSENYITHWSVFMTFKNFEKRKVRSNAVNNITILFITKFFSMIALMTAYIKIWVHVPTSHLLTSLRVKQTKNVFSTVVLVIFV